MTGTLTFLGHSGFFLELPEISLLMDWWKGDLPPIPEEKPLLVLVSHGHSDHFNPGVFALAGTGRPVRFLLGRDIRLTPRHRTQWGLTEETADSCLRMGGGETAEPFPGVVVETLPSTDEGVAFLVTAGGRTVFHAGDLNWWHWEGEDPAWNREMDLRFHEAVAPLAGRRLDLALLPLDPRLGNDGFLGPRAFLETADIRAFVPMHQWEDFGFTRRFLTAYPQYAARTLPITCTGERLAVDL